LILKISCLYYLPDNRQLFSQSRPINNSSSGFVFAARLVVYYPSLAAKVTFLLFGKEIIHSKRQIDSFAVNSTYVQFMHIDIGLLLFPRRVETVY